MEENEAVDISFAADIEEFAANYSAFNKIISRLQRQYLTLKETYTIQSEQLQSVNQTLQSLISRNRTVTEFLNNILNSIPSGVIAIDKSGQVNLINPAAYKILGVSDSKPDGGRWRYSDLICAEGETDCSAISTAATGREFENVEKKVRTADGRVLTLTITTSLIKNQDGEVTGAVELFHDISKVRKMEEQLSRMKILASLGEMAASIAHEIRNPLGGVSGFAALLARDLNQDPSKKEMAEKIVWGVESINQTIETLLDFARHEEVHRQPISIKKYLDGVLDEFPNEYGLPESGNNIYRHFEVDDAVWVELDAQLFKQAFYNLIKNGLEAGNRETKIVVECRYLRGCGSAELPSAENAVEISVEDNGRGIPDEDLNKIFSPFYSTKQNGTGLGLSIAWKIVKAHGGEISAESKRGKGTKFAILLPVSQAANGQKAARKGGQNK